MRSAVLRPVWWWAGPILLAAAALASDAADRRIPFDVWTTGPVDEVAHLATAALGLLVVACFVDAPRRFYVAALIASVAIDVDHIPLYLGLLGNQAQRPVTHSLSTVAVFAAAAAASRRRRAVLAGVATGLMLHFARDIAEGYPGVRVLWPLQDTSWMVGYRWFLGMIVVFTAARLVLVSASLPHTRILVFRTPSPPAPIPRSSDGPVASGARLPGLEPQGPDHEAAREAWSRTSLRNPPWCRDQQVEACLLNEPGPGNTQPRAARDRWFSSGWCSDDMRCGPAAPGRARRGGPSGSLRLGRRARRRGDVADGGGPETLIDRGSRLAIMRM